MNSFRKCDQIRRNLRIWSHLLKKSLMKNFIFCAVIVLRNLNEINFATVHEVLGNICCSYTLYQT